MALDPLAGLESSRRRATRPPSPSEEFVTMPRFGAVTPVAVNVVKPKNARVPTTISARTID